MNIWYEIHHSATAGHFNILYYWNLTFNILLNSAKFLDPAAISYGEENFQIINYWWKKNRNKFIAATKYKQGTDELINNLTK